MAMPANAAVRAKVLDILTSRIGEADVARLLAATDGGAAELRDKDDGSARERAVRFVEENGLPRNLVPLHTEGFEVDEDGNTRVEVLAGAVSFEGEGRWVYVPGGAVCTASRGGGPTPPVWKDQVAWIGQVDALARAEEPETAGALELLAKLDSLTLWHLLGARSDWVRRESLSQLQRREPVTGDFSPEELIGDSDRERSTLLRQLPWYF